MAVLLPPLTHCATTIETVFRAKFIALFWRNLLRLTENFDKTQKNVIFIDCSTAHCGTTHRFPIEIYQLSRVKKKKKTDVGDKTWSLTWIYSVLIGFRAPRNLRKLHRSFTSDALHNINCFRETSIAKLLPLKYFSLELLPIIFQHSFKHLTCKSLRFRHARVMNSGGQPFNLRVNALVRTFRPDL